MNRFVAGGKAFASGFGMDQNTGNLVTAAFVLAYTIIGGFLAGTFRVGGFGSIFGQHPFWLSTEKE